jgi:hypothetical protein
MLSRHQPNVRTDDDADLNKNSPVGVLPSSETGGYDCGGPLVAAVVFICLGRSGWNLEMRSTGP